jgi:hypothetical protein
MVFVIYLRQPVQENKHLYKMHLRPTLERKGHSDRSKPYPSVRTYGLGTHSLLRDKSGVATCPRREDVYKLLSWARTP